MTNKDEIDEMLDELYDKVKCPNCGVMHTLSPARKKMAEVVSTSIYKHVCSGKCLGDMARAQHKERSHLSNDDEKQQ
jgi:hypothetical protein